MRDLATCSRRRYGHTPRRVFAIGGSMKKADLVAVRVTEVSFAPEPFPVRWRLIKFQPERVEPIIFGILVFAFEIERDRVG